MSELALTEKEWFFPIAFSRALKHVAATLSERKARLLACACCRNLSEFTDDAGKRDALSFSEKLADGETIERARFIEDLAFGRIFVVNHRYLRYSHLRYSRFDTYGILDEPFDINFFAQQFDRAARWNKSGGDLVCLRVLRELVGNPFRPVIFDFRWRNSDSIGLARAIYDDRAFDRLPILADALMDAGCEDEQIIAHCRNEGPHVRGCWVVDLVLGKS